MDQYRIKGKELYRELRLHSRIQHRVDKFELPFGDKDDFLEKTSLKLIFKLLNPVFNIVNDCLSSAILHE